MSNDLGSPPAEPVRWVWCLRADTGDGAPIARVVSRLVEGKHRTWFAARAAALQSLGGAVDESEIVVWRAT